MFVVGARRGGRLGKSGGNERYLECGGAEAIGDEVAIACGTQGCLWDSVIDAK